MKKPTYHITEVLSTIVNPELSEILTARAMLTNLGDCKGGYPMEPCDGLFGIEPIFNMNKIKFDILDSWKLLKGYSRANVYINLDNVIKIILNPRTNNMIHAAINALDEGEDYLKTISLGLVSNIINLAQHYRLWLAKNSVDSKIVLFWGYPLPTTYKNAEYISTYRRSYMNQYANALNVGFVVDCIQKAEEFLRTCIHYVNEVYLVSSGELEPSIIPNILRQNVYNTEGDLNIVVSNDMYDYSYVNYEFTVLSPSARKNSEPKLLTKDTAMDVLKRKYKLRKVFDISESFLEYINAILGSEIRNIQKMNGMGFSTIVQGIDIGLSAGFITDTTKDVHMLAGSIREDFRDTFIQNYLCTNIQYQCDKVEPLDVHKISSQIVDKYDESTLNHMNEEYFKRFPIEIINPKSKQILYGTNKSIFDKS